MREAQIRRYAQMQNAGQNERNVDPRQRLQKPEQTYEGGGYQGQGPNRAKGQK